MHGVKQEVTVPTANYVGYRHSSGRTTVRTSRLRLIALGTSLLVLLTACGQKPGIHVQGANDEGVVVGAFGQEQASVVGSQDLGTVPAGPADSSSDQAAVGEPGPTGQSAPAAQQQTSQQTTSNSQTTTQDPQPQQTQAPDPQQTQAPNPQPTQNTSGKKPLRGSDRTGVTADLIRVGNHAPVTGAAPIPSRSFEVGGDLYYRWLTEKKGETILGRTEVEVIFRDDKYTPSSAVQVCREMNKGNQVFSLYGGGGTDQIQACAQYADANGVPYFSSGVTETGLRGLDYYFAGSMSYKQQGRLLAQLVAREFPGKKIAAIVTETPNFDDAVAGWEQGLAEQGLTDNYYKTMRHPKGDNSWYQAFAIELQQAQVDIVYPLTAPTDYINFAKRAEAQAYTPQFVGVGVSMGLNAVANAICPTTDGAIFFSPFPALELADQLDPEFNQAAQHFQLGSNADDIVWALWGAAKQFHELLKRYEATYGTDLTREDFRDLVESAQNVKTNVLPPVSYSPDNHFGASQVHVLRLDCGARQYRNFATFQSSFR